MDSNTTILSAYRPSLPPLPRLGFTLLEVLVAVGILSFLLVALVSSQSQMLQILHHTDRVLQAQQITRQELEKVLQNPQLASPGKSTGGYDEDHPLHGSRWERTVTESTIFEFRVYKVEYRIIWRDMLAEKSYEESIYIAPNKPG